MLHAVIESFDLQQETLRDATLSAGTLYMYMYMSEQLSCNLAEDATQQSDRPTRLERLIVWMILFVPVCVIKQAA